MVELDYFKSKLINFLKNYSPELVNNKEWIEELSDTAYDDMNRLIQSGVIRYEAQDIASADMLSKVPDNGYTRLDNLYEDNFNHLTNTEGLPLLNTLPRRETIFSLLKSWPEYTAEITDQQCIQRIIEFTKEASNELQ